MAIVMAEVAIQEDVRHGKPVVKGTRITVDEVMGMLEAGMAFDEIEREYGLTKEEVQAAIRYVDSFVHDQQVHTVSA